MTSKPQPFIFAGGGGGCPPKYPPPPIYLIKDCDADLPLIRTPRDTHCYTKKAGQGQHHEAVYVFFRGQPKHLCLEINKNKKQNLYSGNSPTWGQPFRNAYSDKAVEFGQKCVGWAIYIRCLHAYDFAGSTLGWLGGGGGGGGGLEDLVIVYVRGRDKIVFAVHLSLQNVNVTSPVLFLPMIKRERW
jgi:hypothetical protein